MIILDIEGYVFLLFFSVSFGFFFMNDDFEGLEYSIGFNVNRFLLDVHQRTAEARRDLLRRGCIGKALSPVLAAAASPLKTCRVHYSTMVKKILV